MTVHKASTQGQSFKYDTETALGTAAGASVFFRPDTWDFPTNISQEYMPEAGGHINPAEVNKAIPFKDGSDTGTFTITARRATTTLEPSVGIFLKAAGWTQAKLTGATTVKTATTTTSLLTTADVAIENGSFCLVETTDDRYEPVHVAAWTAPDTAIPLFAMSADPTDLNEIEQMYTYYPSSDPLAATDTLTFIHQSRVEDGAGNAQEWTYSGCALILKTITITPNGEWKFEFEVMIANVDVDTGTWAAETDHEVAGVAKFNNDFEFLMVDATAAGAGGMARTSRGITTQVVIDTGMAAQKITSVGASTDVNSVGGYVPVLSQPTWTITSWFERALIDDFETEFIGGAGTNPAVALMAINSTQDLDLFPALAISSPKCNLIKAPKAILDGTASGIVEMEYVFGANAANLNEADARATLGKASDAGSQAIYFGISGTAP